MKVVDAFDYLSSIDYPGRGIVIARTPCGRKIRVGYFIMGRSANSQNRIFAETEDGIETRAFDESKLEDPSLIIYHPVRKANNKLIVTNGDQTDTIADFMKEGKSFEEALRTRTFEPDGPNWTPRISAVVDGSSYQMSILKSADGSDASVHRYFFDYVDELPGIGHILHTYKQDGSPIPSFEGEPVPFQLIREPFDAFSNHLWDALSPEYKVSLYTAVVECETGEVVKSMIFNKNTK